MLPLLQLRLHLFLYLVVEEDDVVVVIHIITDLLETGFVDEFYLHCDVGQQKQQQQVRFHQILQPFQYFMFLNKTNQMYCFFRILFTKIVFAVIGNIPSIILNRQKYSFVLLLYIQLKMASPLQKADQNIVIASPHSQTTKMDSHTPHKAYSPQPKQTEKRCYNYDLAANQNMYQKQTERNLGNSIVYHPLCLTERSSVTNRQERWSINFEQEMQPKQGLTKIYNVLQDNGILEAFQSFESLRNFIIDDLSVSRPSKANNLKNNLSLFQFIADFKTKFLHIESNHEQDYKETDRQTVKELLKQVSFLRNENYRLRERLHQNSPKMPINNSLIENSITFTNNSSAMSKNTSESNSSIELKLTKLQNQSIQPFYLIRQQTEKYVSSFEEKSTIEGTYKHPFSQAIQQQKQNYDPNILSESYVQNPKQSKCNLQAEWQRSLAKTIVVCKQIFKNYIFAANAALFHSGKLKQLTNIVHSYNTYRPKLIDRSQSEFLIQSNRITQLMSSLSQSILTLIKSSFHVGRKVFQE